ncbi:1,4-dihydroxy-2-naphthoate polyprenyltransferase [Thalassotalea sp. PLHSN55]|uniref:1,4-dihydroxy-2-naphthoate polyprenyltransferase n=1 Tax=Thalassotalea sp. PLHSN55 TaxID=3435888 RepID=UPI003F8723E2
MSPWVYALRPKTLPASVSPILLASALAVNQQHFDFLLFIVVLSCAVCLQIAVNLANDYFDAKSGVDTEERLGPIRVTQSQLIASSSVFYATCFFSLVAMCLGLFLVWQSDWRLLIAGALSLMAVFAYSGGPWPLASHSLGEVTVFVFFGMLAVGGSYYIFAQELSLTALLFGMICGCYSAAIMLVNNIRDRVTDAKAGKKTLAVRLGDSKARFLYMLLLTSAMALHVYAMPSQINIWLALMPVLLCALPSLWLAKQVLSQPVQQFNVLLARSAQLLLSYCVVTSLVLLNVEQIL